MFQCVTSLTDKRAEGRKWVEEEEQEGPQKKHEKKNQIYPSSCKKLASSESNYGFPEHCATENNLLEMI